MTDSTREYPECFNFGPFHIEVTHHEWNCGDGCCSTSGKTAEIKEEGKATWYYGDGEFDSHLSYKEFADKAFLQYLIERDLQIQMGRQDLQYQQLFKESNQYLDGLAMSWVLFKDLIDMEVFKKSKLAQEYKGRVETLISVLYGLSSPHQQILYIYRNDLNEALEIKSESEVEGDGNDQ